MAKFPLKMSDGESVRTLDELKKHFDLVSILSYYDNGKLLTWLEDHYYDEEAKQVEAIDRADSDLKQKLCDIFGVTLPENRFKSCEPEGVSFTDVVQKNEKLDILRRYTADDTIIDNIDRVAFNQEDLANLILKGEKEIYLCGERFALPDINDISFIGINFPSIFQNKYEGVVHNCNSIITLPACEYKEILKELWIELAESGHPVAQIEMANLCWEHIKPHISFKWIEWAHSDFDEAFDEAFKWGLKAAEQGNIMSQIMIGKLYYNGNGTKRSYAKAFNWYLKAAEQGNAEAQFFVGGLYKDGKGIDQSYEDAFKWYMKSAVQGYAEAQFALGTLYEDGYGVEKNYDNAGKWYMEAAKQGHLGAKQGCLRIGLILDPAETKEDFLVAIRKTLEKTEEK